MTQKEAIRILSEMDCNDPEVADVKEAVSMAVRALEVQNDDWTEIIDKEEVHKAVREKFKGWKIKTINKLYDENFVEG